MVMESNAILRRFPLQGGKMDESYFRTEIWGIQLSYKANEKTSREKRNEPFFSKMPDKGSSNHLPSLFSRGFPVTDGSFLDGYVK